ncbi:MAG: peptidoglycan editing factor PgeF [Anaerolineales bacterium]|nr:peptidoglycan editing factor PgeF [Anaerolineales bacterium]
MFGIMEQEISVHGHPSPTMIRIQDNYPENLDTVYPAKIQTIWVYRVRAFDTFPGLKHAIFTRRGGVSPSPFRSLNLSVSVGDNPQTVQKNFFNACHAVSVPPEKTVSSYLVHGADVSTIDKSNQQLVIGQSDALITAEPGIYLFMRFGDCTPLLFFDPIRKAVGLTHAGWRGTMQDAAGATVKAMIDRLGCEAKNIIAVIGPAIGPCCYEVGPEVMTAASQTFDKLDHLFSYPNGPKKRAYFDLWEANQQQLAKAGVRHIIQSKLCTACRTDDFFSHRAEKGRTGRFGVVIGLEEKIE